MRDACREGGVARVDAKQVAYPGAGVEGGWEGGAGAVFYERALNGRAPPQPEIVGGAAVGWGRRERGHGSDDRWVHEVEDHELICGQEGGGEARGEGGA